MAKRTYWDANGYKRKKRKRGTPEGFSTLTEWKEYVANKKRKTLKENPIKKVDLPKPEALVLLEKLEEVLRGTKDQS